LTTYSEVVSAFESITKCKYVLPDELVKQWFINALAEYELEIDPLGFDIDTNTFIAPSKKSDSFESDGTLKKYVIINLAELMKSFYLQQEVRRVNQLNNVIGKDISLNGTGDTKRLTRAEADALNTKLEYMHVKQKTPAFI